MNCRNWYKADSGAGVTVSTGSGNITTAAETIGAITLTAEWSAKAADNSTAFNLSSGRLSLVDTNDGKTYVYNGTVDAAHKQEVAAANRGGEQFIIVSVTLSATGLNSAQYGTYGVVVNAADVLKLYQTESATSVTWGTSNFAASLTLADMVINSAAPSKTYSFIVVAAGADSQQNAVTGSLSVAVTAK